MSGMKSDMMLLGSKRNSSRFHEAGQRETSSILKKTQDIVFIPEEAASTTKWLNQERSLQKLYISARCNIATHFFLSVCCHKWCQSACRGGSPQNTKKRKQRKRCKHDVAVKKSIINIARGRHNAITSKAWKQIPGTFCYRANTPI